MSVRILRGARGSTVALLGFSGLLFSCNSLGLSSSRSARAAAPPDARKLALDDNFGIADLEQHFEEVAQRVSASVVAISATDAKVDGDEALRSDRINPEKLAAMLDPVDRTVGTGFVVDSDGYIVTNDHVIANCDNIWVTTDTHRVYPAVVVGTDPRSDLAVLKIPASHLTVAKFAPNLVRRGQWTIAIGNPYGLAGAGEMAVSVGIVSALGRSLPKLSTKEDRLYCDLIQTTAQINPGNSGGPLFDVQGNVIGINAAVILPQKQTNGIGFAIPITPRVRQIIADLKEGREVKYGRLGVRVVSATPQELRDAGLGDGNIGEGGARVESVESNSPAAKAKLLPGDIIAKFNGQDIVDSEQFVRLVGEAPVEHRLTAVVYRKGKQLKLHLATAPRPAPQAAITRESQRFRWCGMLLGPIPRHWDFAGSPRPNGGLMVVAIDPQSPFIKEGVAQGSIITTIAGKAVSDVLQLQRILNDTAPNACKIQLNKPRSAMVSIGE
ncbi:MAG TPA: trypsin-like peptidase domain-containing protein [Tepidisphaeraceae bacterium]|nr:trypsin-like peptidase domain-containing protein [Tepidisphaeraceae bacterium]